MGRQRPRNRVNATGRSNTSRFARLDHRMLISNAYRGLSPNARSLLVELTMLDKGDNNGSLYLSVRDAAHRMGVADLSAASRAFDELVALGFIQRTQDAYFQVKAAETSRARCWRLTWLAGPGRKAPSWEFMNREPSPHTAARKRMERGLKALKAYRRARDLGRLPVLDSGTLNRPGPEMPATAVLDSNTCIRENGSFPRKLCDLDFATHLAAPLGEGAPNNRLGWWQSDCAQQIFGLSIISAFAGHHWSEAA